MSLFELWLITSLLPSINCWANTVFFLTTFSFMANAGGVFFMSHGEGEIRWKPWLLVWVISGVICSVVPSRKEMILIAGGYAASHSEEMKTLLENVLKAANAWLEKVERDAADDGKK